MKCLSKNDQVEDIFSRNTNFYKNLKQIFAGGAPVKEVLIQGNQIAFAGRLLTETYKIHKKYIRGLELAVKPKKGK
jgi:hypothetical protein